MRPATYADIDYVAHRLRPADHDEFVATTGRSPEPFMAKALSVDGSAWCGTLDDIPVAIYGLDISDHGASPWMVGTPAIEGFQVARHLVRHGRKLFREWADTHGKLHNYAYAANTVHIKFIRLLGCEVGDPQPYGALRLPFMEFTYV